MLLLINDQEMKSKYFSTSKRRAFDACLTALRQLECPVKSADYSNGLIEAEKKGGLLSYGHAIEITVKATESARTKVSVTSSSVGVQVIDWGTNSNNEDEIISAIVRALT